MRVDVYGRSGLLQSFPTIDAAVAFASPLATIPGDYVVLLIFAGERLVDVMAWGDLPRSPAVPPG